MPKLTLKDVEIARANTPVDYYRKDADTLDTRAYKAFVNGPKFVLGAAFAGDGILVQSTKYTQQRKTKRRYQVYVFLDDKRDQKLDHLCLYIPVWAFFKTETFEVQSSDETSTEATDTFSVHAIQGSKHVRVASDWLIEKNVCTIHTEWFTVKFTYDPYNKAARFEYTMDQEEGDHPMSKERQRLRVKGGTLVRGHLSFTPDVKAALDKAAKEENTSTSIILNQILEDHPRIAKHLPPDEENDIEPV